jgi:serine/threonine-protein kinase
MDQLEAKPIAGTEGAVSPFFSPDGRWLGFFADSKLKKVSMSGGTPVILSDVPSPLATATWGADGTIVVRASVTSELVQVSADGGVLQALTTFDSGEFDHVSPQFLPDGETLLFTVESAGNSQIVVQSLETQERRVVLERAAGARYVPSGHLVFPQTGTLMAVAFDLEQLEVTGSPIPVLEGVAESGEVSWVAHLAFSDTGTLVYVSGGSDPREGSILVWVDRKGAEQPLAAPPRPYNHPRLSPDGQQLAVSFAGAVWTYDIQGDTLTRRTFEGDGTFPLWTPDGKRITFQSTRLEGPSDLFWKPADGTGAGELLLDTALSKTPHSWSPDGEFLAYTEVSPSAAGDIWVLPFEGERNPEPFLVTPFSETGAVL